MDFFFPGSVNQSAVGIIEKGADTYVNRGGMMVIGFIHHCKREGLSSNPGLTLVFFFLQPNIHTSKIISGQGIFRVQFFIREAVLPWKRNKQSKFSMLGQMRPSGAGLKKFDLTPNITTRNLPSISETPSSLSRLTLRFYSGSVDQSAVGIIEKGLVFV
jgi:hypothetical protein